MLYIEILLICIIKITEDKQYFQSVKQKSSCD